MKLISELKVARERTSRDLKELEETLTEVYNKYPGMFPKRPSEMSIADKMRFSEDLINFAEVVDQYK